MKTRQWFLMIWMVLLILVAVFSSSLAAGNLPEIIKKIQPSVVVILTYDNEGQISGQGSGFFINERGDVITNRHVLVEASSAKVKTANGKIYPITKVLAEDEAGDLILVSVDIPASAVHASSVSATIPEVGERVIVIGSPEGLEQTVSEGIVSAVRDIPAFGKIIQITAPTSPGSSGSPVVNMKGEIIGVATFQVVEGQNLNFAIPGERSLKLAEGKLQTFPEWVKVGEKERLVSVERLQHAGLVLVWSEDYEKALSYFEQAVKKDTGYGGAYFWIGYCNDELGRYNEAVEAYKQAIRIKPDYALAHFNLGGAYTNLGRYNEAVEANKQAISIKPDLAEAHYNLGVAYGKLGRYNEAVEAYKQAIRIKPDFAEAHGNLGGAYNNLGRYDEAVEAYKQAIRIKPDDALAYYNLGGAYANLGRYNEAVEAYKQAIRIKPDFAEAHGNLGGAYANLGRYKEAVEAYKQAIRIKPDYAVAHFNLGISHLALGDSGSALEEYKILKTLDRDLANKLFNLIYK
ncbi:MAG: tetratricopeptide repeat protein [Candidatus Zixiibacteriota bacterium]